MRDSASRGRCETTCIVPGHRLPHRIMPESGAESIGERQGLCVCRVEDHRHSIGEKRHKSTAIRPSPKSGSEWHSLRPGGRRFRRRQRQRESAKKERNYAGCSPLPTYQTLATSGLPRAAVIRQMRAAGLRYRVSSSATWPERPVGILRCQDR